MPAAVIKKKNIRLYSQQPVCVCDNYNDYISRYIFDNFLKTNLVLLKLKRPRHKKYCLQRRLDLKKNKKKKKTPNIVPSRFGVHFLPHMKNVPKRTNMYDLSVVVKLLAF